MYKCTWIRGWDSNAGTWGEMSHSHPVSCLLLSTSNSVDEPNRAQNPSEPPNLPSARAQGSRSFERTTAITPWLLTPNPGHGIVHLGILSPKSLLHGAERREGDGTLLLALSKEPASLSSGPDLLSLVPSVLTASPSEISILLLFPIFPWQSQGWRHRQIASCLSLSSTSQKSKQTMLPTSQPCL